MLLFITARDRDRLCYWVSIHLMLLFIELLSARIWIAFVFQYISCYSLSMISSVHLKITKCFNTSHVTLYRQSISLLHLYLKFQYISCYSLSIIETLWNVKKFVSIHLMLLFIELGRIAREAAYRVSIHLMLLFIMFLDSFLRTISAFQYISCYSLSSTGMSDPCQPLVSIHLMLLFIMCYHRMSFFVKGFNTSHVTLYQFRKPRLYVLSAFQYISCYSLSMRLSEIKIPTDLFQYISCYSLSPY